MCKCLPPRKHDVDIIINCHVMRDVANRVVLAPDGEGRGEWERDRGEKEEGREKRGEGNEKG